MGYHIQGAPETRPALRVHHVSRPSALVDHSGTAGRELDSTDARADP
jgi:hypothetical protein